MNLIIQDYFDEIELRLLENPLYKDYSIIRKDILYSEAKIRIHIDLSNGDLLEVFEYIAEDKGRLISKKYSYHWQDIKGNLKFRWDNAPHHKELDNFPHHIHYGDNRIESISSVPNILDVLDEIDK